MENLYFSALPLVKLDKIQNWFVKKTIYLFNYILRKTNFFQDF